MTDPIELVPCPFCGGEATVRTGSDFTKSHYFIMCTTCDVNTAINLSETEVRKLWNRRAPLQAAGEMAGEKPGPCETCGGSGEIPTVEGDEALCPACAAAPVEDVEKVAKAIWNVDAHPARKNWVEAIQSDDYSEALNDCRAYARAALAAIGRT